MLLGFSTGCLYKTHDRVAPETFDVFRRIGANAIEIMCVDVQAIEKLITQINPNDLRGFEHVSLHAPGIYAIDTLELLKKAHNIFQFNTIVIHPDEIDNWAMFSGYDLPFAIENMDWHKEVGKYTDSMKTIFENHDTQMALDLNHCFSNDPSMHLAKEMFEAFAGRISEIHLSGFQHLHEPLFQTQQVEIMDAIPDKRLPIIIESGCETVEDAQKEFDYVKEYLEK